MKVPFSWLRQFVDIDITAQELEEKLFGSCFETEDQKNAMSAFVEKRKPDPFVNR